MTSNHTYSMNRTMSDEHEKLALAATKKRVSDWISSSMEIIKMRETTECPRSEINFPEEQFRVSDEEIPTRETKHVGRRRTCPEEFDAKAVLRRFMEEQTLTTTVVACDDTKKTVTMNDVKHENVAGKDEILDGKYDKKSNRIVTSDKSPEIVERRLNSKTPGEAPKQNVTEKIAVDAKAQLVNMEDSTRKADHSLPDHVKPSERTKYSLVREIFPPQFDANLSSTSEVSWIEDCKCPLKGARDGATEPRQREKSPEMDPESPTSENSAYYSVKSLKHKRVHTEKGNCNIDSQCNRQVREMNDPSIGAGICATTAERSTLDSRRKQLKNIIFEERQHEKPQMSNSGDFLIEKRQECATLERKKEPYNLGGNGNNTEGTFLNRGTTKKINEQLLNVKQVKTESLKESTDTLTKDTDDNLIVNRKEPKHSKVTVDMIAGSELTRITEHIVGNAQTVPSAKHVERKSEKHLQESVDKGEKRMTESLVSDIGDYLTGIKTKKEKGAKIEETNEDSNGKEKGVRENLSVLSNMCKNLIGNVSNALNAKEVATGSKKRAKNSSYIGNHRPTEKLHRQQTGSKIDSNATECQRKKRQQLNSRASMNNQNGGVKIHNDNSAEFSSKQNGWESVMTDQGIIKETRMNKKRPSSKLTDYKNKTKEAGIFNYEDQASKYEIATDTKNQRTSEMFSMVNHVHQKAKRQVYFKVDTTNDVRLNEETRTDSKLKESHLNGATGKETRDQGCGDTSIYSYMQQAPTDEANGRPISGSELSANISGRPYQHRLSEKTDGFTQCDDERPDNVNRVYTTTQTVREKTYNKVKVTGNSVTDETKQAKLSATPAERWSTEKTCKTLTKNYSMPLTICHSSTSEIVEDTSELSIDIRKVEGDSEETQHFNSPIRGLSPEKAFALQKQKTISVVNIVLGDNDADYNNERNERAVRSLGTKRTAQKTTHSKKTIEKPTPKLRTIMPQKIDRNMGTNTPQIKSFVNFKRLDKPPARSILRTQASQLMEPDTSFEYKLIPEGLQQKLLNATLSKRTQRNVQQLVRHKDLPDREITTMVTNSQTDDLQNETSRNMPGSLHENITDFKRRPRAATIIDDKKSSLKNTEKHSQPVRGIPKNKRREHKSGITVNVSNTTSGSSNTETTRLGSGARNSTGTSTSPARRINDKTVTHEGTQCCYKPRENKGLFNVNNSYTKENNGNGSKSLLTNVTEEKIDLNRKEQMSTTDDSELLSSDVSKIDELSQQSAATNSRNHGAGESLKYRPSNNSCNKPLPVTKPKISIRTFYSGTVLDKNPYLTNSPENNWSNNRNSQRFPASQNRTYSVPSREPPYRVNVRNGFASKKSNAVTASVRDNRISNVSDDVIIDITASESQTDINIQYNGECQGFADQTVHGNNGQEIKQRKYYTNNQRQSRLGNS